ncbi:MAG: hypothetical protein HND50_00755 [Calditrichaeota bacterium]|nr:hypothetical protein [Calditrichota bacterium]
MTEKNEVSLIEKQKIDLIKLRIKNKFYEKDEVFNRIISELMDKEFKIK